MCRASDAVRILGCIYFLLVLVSPLRAEGLIAKVEVENSLIDQTKKEMGAVTFSLAEPCKVNLFISDVQGNIVRNLLEKEELDEGVETWVWDGQDNFENPVANGLYFPIIQCMSKRKGTFTYNPSASAWGAQMEAKNIRYDEQSQLLIIEVGAMAYGRLRVGLKDGGPVYKTLVPWRLWQPGKHEIQWDGRDMQGYKWVMDEEKLAYSFDAFDPPENVFIVSGAGENRFAIQPEYRTYPIHPPSGEPRSFFALVADSMRGEPELAVTWPDNKKEGEYVNLKGNASCTVGFADTNKLSAMFEKGSELIIYVDDRYVTEKPLESFPATIGFNTGDFTNGNHIITINLLTTDDRAGISIQQVKINN